MLIQHNIPALNSHRRLGINNTALGKSLEKLASGYRINVAADDAAGLAISEKMRAQITGLSRAVLNAQDGVSLVQTAEGALQEVHSALNRLEQMAVQAANGVYAGSDRQKLQDETDALLSEFDRISKATNFNGISLLDGSLSKNKGIANAAIAQAPPPYATPVAAQGFSTAALGVQGLAMADTTRAAETAAIQPLGGDISPQALETISFNTLQAGDSGTGWSFTGGVLTISADGDFAIEGTGVETSNRIVVSSGVTANITLSNVNINIVNDDVDSPMDMGGATVNLNLIGSNTLRHNTHNSGASHAGLRTTGGNLTIDGTGSLSAYGGYGGAGIGGGELGEGGGTITINGGTIIAQGRGRAAGIGSSESAGGTVTINGGNVTAQGGTGAAGIGGDDGGNGGNITITGGTVKAVGGVNGAGIGGGDGGNGGNITITGNAVVEATGTLGIAGGAGVGGGSEADGGTIVINGNATVTATGGAYAAGIGGGDEGSGGTIIIDGDATVIATGSERGAGIGGGENGNGGDITIKSGDVTANSGVGAAGIGGGYHAEGGNIIIEGGKVSATGNVWGAGIGGGSDAAGGNITIRGDAEVNAQSVKHGAGIGGGSAGAGGTIHITGNAVVQASGGDDIVGGAGIGGGAGNGDVKGGAGGSITIDGNASVKATGGEDAAGIGGGFRGDGGTITITGDATVTATGILKGAGIGGGGGLYSSSRGGSGGNITIDGNANVQVTGGGSAAAVGGGYYGDGGNLTVNGGSLEILDGGIGIGGGIGGNPNGVTTVTGGNITNSKSINMENTKDGSGSTAYKVTVQGVSFTPGAFVSYEINGQTYNALINNSGELYMYLADNKNNTIVTLTYDGNEYQGILNVLTNHQGTVDLGPPDVTAPALIPGAGDRTGSATGTVKFTSDEAGRYYYAVVEKGAQAPTINTSGTGIACDTSEQTINLSGLSGNSAKDVYVVVKDAMGNVSQMVKVELAEYVVPDTTPPDLFFGYGDRTGQTTGTVNFYTDEAGEYYYAVVEKDAQAPIIDTSGSGTACDMWLNTIDVTGLTGDGAKDVYVVVKDAAGNVSNTLKVALGEYIPPPRYEVELTLPDGATFPADTDITVTVNGENRTVATDGTGKLVVELPDGNHTIELGNQGKNYTGTATVSGGATAIELAEVIVPPPPPPAKGLVLQIGDTADDYNKLTVYIEGTSAAHLGLSGLSLATQEAASAALSKIRDAIERVSVNRGQLGAYQNRLEHTINNLNNTVENMTAAESRIRDADMADEMMAFTKYSVLAQAAQAMLAQANMQPQQVMQMLR